MSNLEFKPLASTHILISYVNPAKYFNPSLQKWFLTPGGSFQCWNSAKILGAIDSAANQENNVVKTYFRHGFSSTAFHMTYPRAFLQNWPSCVFSHTLYGPRGRIWPSNSIIGGPPERAIDSAAKPRKTLENTVFSDNKKLEEFQTASLAPNSRNQLNYAYAFQFPFRKTHDFHSFALFFALFEALEA